MKVRVDVTEDHAGEADGADAPERVLSAVRAHLFPKLPGDGEVRALGALADLTLAVQRQHSERLVRRVAHAAATVAKGG